MLTLKSIPKALLIISCTSLSLTAFTATEDATASLTSTVTSVVTPVLETRDHFDDQQGKFTDVDDPAIWIHPAIKANSLVITTLKKGGLDVYDLNGKLLQFIKPAPAPECQQGAADCDNKGGRFNNVDLIYGFKLGDEVVDIAVASDRGLDKLAIYRIDIDTQGKAAITDITATDVPLIFTQNQQEVNDGATAYGLATVQTDKAMAFVTQNGTTRIEQLELFDNGNGRIGYRAMEKLVFPSQFSVNDGSSWTPCTDEDGELPHFEGLVADPTHNALYLAQEDVGIWRVRLDQPTDQASWNLFAKVRKFGVPYSRTWDQEENEYACELDFRHGTQNDNLWADTEGLTLYDGANGKGYILASSQGNNTVAVYDRITNNYVGSFTVADGKIDAVNETDGMMVVNVNLGEKFPQGLLVMQDGQNVYDQNQSGAGRSSTNFKYVSWEDVAKSMNLQVNTQDRTRD